MKVLQVLPKAPSSLVFPHPPELVVYSSSCPPLIFEILLYFAFLSCQHKKKGQRCYAVLLFCFYLTWEQKPSEYYKKDNQRKRRRPSYCVDESIKLLSRFLALYAPAVFVSSLYFITQSLHVSHGDLLFLFFKNRSIIHLL